MTRAKWKGPYIDWHTLSRKKINPKLWTRSSIIPSILLNTNVSIYNGREFKRVTITKSKIGFKFGEFSFTRKFTIKKKLRLLSLKNLCQKKIRSLWDKNLIY